MTETIDPAPSTFDPRAETIDTAPSTVDPRARTLRFTAPNASTSNIPPGYYMLFYVDCMGKPSRAQMVRFDDRATAP